jgi:hypothetical protein
MVEWKPIDQGALKQRIALGEARMTSAQRRLWQAIRINPEKWKQEPYGDQGGGFWVVGIIGRSVVWYNDIEDGFNRSCYSFYGTIDDYWCNQDELDLAIDYLANVLSGRPDLTQLGSEV